MTVEPIPSPISRVAAIEQSLLEVLNNEAAVTQFKRTVYEEDGPHVLSNILRDAMQLRLPSRDFDRLVNVIQAAWNHLPHRRLADLSPAELFERGTK